MATFGDMCGNCGKLWETHYYNGTDCPNDNLTMASPPGAKGHFVLAGQSQQAIKPVVAPAPKKFLVKCIDASGWGTSCGGLFVGRVYEVQEVPNRPDVFTWQRHNDKVWVIGKRTRFVLVNGVAVSGNHSHSQPKVVKEEETNINDWRSWQHKAIGDCPCGIRREQCSYHR